MNNEVRIVDTTLRDGEQSPGIVFSYEKKIEMAKYLEKIGVYQIEAGIPAIGPTEKDVIKAIVENRKSTFISTWNRLNKEDIKASIECNPDIIHLSVPTSDIQIFSKLNKSKDWLERTLVDCVYFAKEHNFEVTIGFEDASRTDINYLLKLCEILGKLEVNTIRYADTVGILTPTRTHIAITELIKNTDMDIEIHAHNDFGMALANSIEAVKCGAKYVNCTLNGIGERAGNCDLQKFIKASEEFFIVID